MTVAKKTTKKKSATKLNVRQQIAAINQLAEAFHANSVKKGFWDSTPDLASRVASIPVKLMLIVTEAAEGMEDFRNSSGPPESFTALQYDIHGKPIGFASELSDIAIRTFELAAGLKINLGKAILQKHLYNKSRARLHGGKRA